MKSLLSQLNYTREWPKAIFPLTLPLEKSWMQDIGGLLSTKTPYIFVNHVINVK
jgi:hypothetical protein